MAFLSDIDKYKFPFNWFIDTYDSLNDTKAYQLDKSIQNKIDQIQLQNALNYPNFIEEITKILNISPNDKMKYLEKEEKCLLCNKNYPFTYEIFINFRDFHTCTDINDKFCFSCSESNFSCANCNGQIEITGPYEQTIYIWTDNSYPNSHMCICEICKQNNKDLPMVALLYKNIEIQMDLTGLKK